MRCFLKFLFRSVIIIFVYNKLFKGSYMVIIIMSEMGICNFFMRKDIVSYMVYFVVEGVGIYNFFIERRRKYLE